MGRGKPGLDRGVVESLEKLQLLWSRERIATRARFAEERTRIALPDRVRRGLALDGLVVDDLDVAPGGGAMLWLVPTREASLDDLRVRQGAPVMLWRGESEAHDDDSFRGVVARKTRTKLGIAVDDELPEEVMRGAYVLDREAPEVTFDRGDAALAPPAEPTDEERALLDVLFADHAPTFDADIGQADFFDEALNADQRRAVEHALSADTVALVHGPPGTGKTRTLVEVARRAVARGDRVLCTAASNTAVDNLGERLSAAGVPVVRVGHPARVSEALTSRTLDALMRQTREWSMTQRWIRDAKELRRKIQKKSARGQMDRGERRELYREARRLEMDARGQVAAIRHKVLARCPVVCATSVGAMSRALVGEPFSLVVLDEATQAPDPIALIAMRCATRVIMGGDPRQLPPTVIDPQVAEEGLGTTFFERLATRASESVRMLTVQYRMHEAIMRFPSDEMYEGKLVADESVADRELAQADPLRPGSWVFLDTAGKGFTDSREEDDPSVRNVEQAERVTREVKRVLARGVAPADLALITPYEAQARVLRSLLVMERTEGLEVGTIDGFQGREKDAVIVDLVRSNDAGEVGFLSDIRRMNVAITRARKFLLVVGDSATLSRHPFYARFAEHAEEAGAQLSAWLDDGSLDGALD